MMKNAEKLYRLAMKHIYGDGVEEDNVLAAKLLTEAAEAGHVEAAYNLGICYHYGHGVDVDLKKAYELYMTSAEKGYGRGMDLIGRFYYEGIYLEQDYEKAFEWFKKAAESSDLMAVGSAECEIAQCYEKGHGVPRNRELAKVWYIKAAGHDSEKAMKALQEM